jgi:hypothetical protein
MPRAGDLLAEATALESCSPPTRATFGADAARHGRGRRPLGIVLLPDGNPFGTRDGPAPRAAAELRAQCFRRYAISTDSCRESAAKGFDPKRSSLRFADSVDMILVKRIYSAAEVLLFRDCPSSAPRQPLPPVRRHRSATAEIRGELEAVLHEPDAFAPYVQGHANRQERAAGMMNNPAWSAYYLRKNGEPVAGNVERFPKTSAGAQECAARARAQPLTFDTLSLLRPRAHPAAQRPRQHAVHCHLP